jgi:hypothetical protein
MRLVTIFVLAGALSQTPPAPREFKASSNPVSDAVRQLLERESTNLVASAERLPGEKYAYHPTPAQMTFGQLIVHIVQTNVAICSAISATPLPTHVRRARQTVRDRREGCARRRHQALVRLLHRGAREGERFPARRGGDNVRAADRDVACRGHDHDCDRLGGPLFDRGVVPPAERRSSADCATEEVGDPDVWWDRLARPTPRRPSVLELDSVLWLHPSRPAIPEYTDEQASDSPMDAQNGRYFTAETIRSIEAMTTSSDVRRLILADNARRILKIVERKPARGRVPSRCLSRCEPSSLLLPFTPN